jgi:hypothetical protein
LTRVRIDPYSPAVLGRLPVRRDGARRRVVLALCTAALAAGCTESPVTGPSASVPTISDLTISAGGNQTVVFRVTTTDPDGDIAGGSCIIHAAGFDVGATIVLGPGAPANSTTAVVTCTVTVSPGASGLTINGALSITDSRGNPSNQIPFTTTLPERPAVAI